ncbi:unnamed protein product, partial [Rotaria magnacalcarata]
YFKSYYFFCQLDSHDGYQNKSTKTVGVGDGGGDHQYLNSQHAHSTRSAPILMGNPKLYT